MSVARAARRKLAAARKAFLESAIRRSVEEGERVPHPVRVSISAERQWDGRWFDVTLTSDGETIAVASFRRIREARAYRRRMIEALKIPGVDVRARTHRARKRQFAAEMQQMNDAGKSADAG
jgi:hypothetical protein